MTGSARVAVIGIGNVLRGDDAVGVHVVEGLRASAERDPGLLPASALLVDGGTLGLELLQSLREAAAVVLVDAACMGGTAGTVTVLRDEAIARVVADPDGRPAGALGELVAVARLLGWLPAEVSVVTVEAGDTAPGLALSPGVAAALEPAREAVRAELWSMDDRVAGMAGATA